jgi:hypothetical protein
MGKHHVVPHERGWAVKAEGKARASAVLPTQAEAIAAAKRIAANQGGYVLIHRRDGTIRTEKVDRIAGTIKVNVGSDESLTVVQRKIERADKRLRVLADKVATKKKRRDRMAAKGSVRKAAAKKAAAKKTPPKRPAPKKAATRARARKPAAKKSIGGKGLKVILASASRAVKKLADKK